MPENGCRRFEKGGVLRRVEVCLNSRRSRYAMTSTATVVSFRWPDECRSGNILLKRLLMMSTLARAKVRECCMHQMDMPHPPLRS